MADFSKRMAPQGKGGGHGGAPKHMGGMINMEKPKNTSIKVLTVIAILETLGILGLAAYWLLVLWK